MVKALKNDKDIKDIKIIVIDDEESMREACRQTLNEQGYTTTVAENGEQGLQLLEQLRPNVALVDLKMPGMGGMEVIEKINDIDPNVISIVITGYGTTDTAVEAMKLGAYDYLCKPFDQEVLLETINRGMEKYRLQKNKKLIEQEKERMIENFAAVVCHQLNSPIAAAAQWIKLLKNELSEPLTGEQKSMLDRACLRLDDLSGLIHDWLELAQIETGARDFKPETLEIEKVINEAWQEIYEKENQNRIGFKLNIKDDVKPVFGNKNLLKQLFVNLFNNSVKFTPSSGNVTVNIIPEGSNTAISVSDTGIGVTAEDLPRLFEPFYRSKRIDAKKEGGSGLGLAIAKKIVSIHGGEINVRSTLNQGTTFTINLPSEQVAPPISVVEPVPEIVEPKPVIEKPKPVREVYRLDTARLDDFLKLICEGREVFALEKEDNQYHLVRANEWQPGNHTIGTFRQIEPLKSLVFKPREFLGSVTSNSEVPEIKERIIIGVKNCDLSALKVYDYVFLKTEPVDPFYAEAREKTIIVSSDCTDMREVCFCSVMNQQPYTKEGFDINISPISKGFVVEAGSDRGEELLNRANQYLEPADESIINERDGRREKMTRRVREQAEKKGLKPGLDFQNAIRKSSESKLWDGFAENCVECGACNFVCGTCHCFLLADGKGDGNTPSRIKQWDSCLYMNFARVAGGANPRKHRAERLYNRFDKKFNFFPQVLNIYACNGCGRCIEACAGKIDIRDVLRKALDES